MSYQTTRMALLATTCLALTIANPAFAQDTNTGTPEAAAEEDASGNDILVTARRTEERLQDVPVSVVVFNQQRITDLNIISAQDLANYTPSLTVNTGFGGDNTTFAIRGFVQDFGTPPSVGVYFADVVAPRGSGISAFPTGDGAGPGNFFDLQNVQVLRGPQGTLFGRNTTGGAILFVPRKPDDEFGGYVEASIGNYDLRRVQGAVNLPLGENVRLRVAADHQNRDGFLRNYTGIGPDDLADLNYTALRASLVIDLAPNLENYLIANYLDSRNNGTIQKLIGCAPALGQGPSFACPQLAAEQAANRGFYEVASQLPQTGSQLEQFQFINTTTWRASDLVTIKNILSYGESESSLAIALNGVNWRFGGQPLTFLTIGTFPGVPSASQSTFTEELQIQGRSSDDRLEYQFGGYYETSDPQGQSGNTLSSLLSCTDLLNLQCSDVIGIARTQAAGNTTAIRAGNLSSTIGTTSSRSIGLYGQASYALTDQLKLTAGLRYTWDRNDSTTTRISYRFPVLPPLTAAPQQVCVDVRLVPSCTETLEQESSAPTWLLDLDYKPSDDVLLYLKYARGYRSGGVFPTGPIGFRTFRPERVDAYEAGLKSSFGSAVRGTFNFAAFYNDFADQQLRLVFTAVPGAPVASATGVVNVGQSRIWGFETEATLSPFENFRLEAAYTYLNTEIREIDQLSIQDPNFIINYNITPGTPLTLSPKHSATLSANYTVPLGDLGSLRFAANYAYTSKMIATYTFVNSPLVAAFGRDYTYLPAFDLLNVNAGWRDIAQTNIDLDFFVNNLTNEKYLTYYGAGAGQGVQTAILGQPRFYGLRLRYEFGGE